MRDAVTARHHHRIILERADTTAPVAAVAAAAVDGDREGGEAGGGDRVGHGLREGALPALVPSWACWGGPHPALGHPTPSAGVLPACRGGPRGALGVAGHAGRLKQACRLSVHLDRLPQRACLGQQCGAPRRHGSRAAAAARRRRASADVRVKRSPPDDPPSIPHRAAAHTLPQPALGYCKGACLRWARLRGAT